MSSGLPGLDVIIPMQDPARLDTLSRVAFSVLLQDYRPVRIHMVCQRFAADAVEAVLQVLAPLLEIAGDVTSEVSNHFDPTRTALLNRGLRAAPGRYVAFLDCGGLIYPEAYRLLIGELEASRSAVAFGGTLDTDVTGEGVVPMTIAKRTVLQGGSLVQLFQEDCCPLHSFVVDRDRIAAEDLLFDEQLATSAEYDFLLRLCAKYPSSFRLKDQVLGETIVSDGESRTTTGGLTAQKSQLPLSPDVQALLDVAETGLTVAGFLAQRSLI